MYQNPIDRLNVLFSSGPEFDSPQSPEIQMYVLASQGEIDLHIIESGEDGCLALAYTLQGELPVLGYDQMYRGQMSSEDAQQRLDDLRSAQVLDSPQQSL